MSSSTVRPCVSAAWVRAALVVALALLAALACAGPAAAVYRSGDDWRHVESTLKELNRRPPSVPVVVLLGGSSARESITTEPAWRAQIAALGGGRVRAYNLGSSSQAFKNDLTIVNALPPVPTIVLIGLNVGRYTSIPPKSVPLAAPSVARGSAVYDSHRFHVGDQLSDAAKRGIVRTWLAVKYPHFRARYAGNAAVLRELIALCQDKGFYPVLLELPLNLHIVRHSWDAARDRYRRGARSAARDAGIPYDDFIAHIGLVSSDFVDVAHLVEPGRAKYQRALSRVVVTRLKQYGLAK
jgi:hypothetical protein